MGVTVGHSGPADLDAGPPWDGTRRVGDDRSDEPTTPVVEGEPHEGGATGVGVEGTSDRARRCGHARRVGT